MVSLYKNEALIHADFCQYKNQIDYVNKLIVIYSITKMNKDSQLRAFERDVLNYYIRFGYSIETKKKIKKELSKSLDNITQANFFLTKKGYLVQSKRNFSDKELCKDLERIRRNFILGNKKILAIGFKLK